MRERGRERGKNKNTKPVLLSVPNLSSATVQYSHLLYLSSPIFQPSAAPITLPQHLLFLPPHLSPSPETFNCLGAKTWPGRCTQVNEEDTHAREHRQGKERKERRGSEGKKDSYGGVYISVLWV